MAFSVMNGISSPILSASAKKAPFIPALQFINTTGSVSVINDYAVIAFTSVGMNTLTLMLNTTSTTFGYIAVGGGGSGGKNTTNAGGGGGGGVSYIPYLSATTNYFNSSKTYTFNVGLAAPNISSTYSGLRGGDTILNYEGGNIVATGGYGGYNVSATNANGGNVLYTVTGSINSTQTNKGGAYNGVAGGDGLSVTTEIQTLNGYYAGGGGGSGGSGVAGGSGGLGGGGTGSGNNGVTAATAGYFYGAGGGGIYSSGSSAGYQGVIYIWIPLSVFPTDTLYIPSITFLSSGIIGSTYIDLSMNTDVGTMYTVTATPTAINTFNEFTVTQTCPSAGMGVMTNYRLMTLAANTNYDITVVATNVVGSSTSSTVTNITTVSASVPASPTITIKSTWTRTVSTIGFNGFNWYICSGKSNPHIVYAASGFNSTSGGSTFYGTVLQSFDYGKNFATVYYSTNAAGSNVFSMICCSDDGKYIYAGSNFLGLVYSTDYGKSWRNKQPVATGFSVTAYGIVSCDSTGQYVMIQQGQTIAWSNNYATSFTTGTLPYTAPFQSYSQVIDRYTATIPLCSGSGATINNKYYTFPSNKFNTSATASTILSSSIAMGSNTTYLVFNRTSFERNIICTSNYSSAGGGTTNYFSATGLGTILTVATPTGNCIPCIVSNANFILLVGFQNGGNSRYSRDNGSTWTALSTSPFNLSTIQWATASLVGDLIYVYLYIGTGPITLYTVTFTVQ